MRARLDDTWYVASGDIRVIPRYADPLGTATIPPCEGEGGSSFEAFAIVGVRPDAAFASPDFEDLVFIAEGTHAKLPWLQRLRREPACLEPDEPVSLEGPWLGILGSRHQTEVDLVPPYTLSMRVDDASVKRYERSFLTIHVGPELGMPLDRRDIRDVLQHGGTVAVSARCRDHEFWAEEVEAAPPA